MRDVKKYIVLSDEMFLMMDTWEVENVLKEFALRHSCDFGLYETALSGCKTVEQMVRMTEEFSHDGIRFVAELNDVLFRDRIPSPEDGYWEEYTRNGLNLKRKLSDGVKGMWKHTIKRWCKRGR